MQIRIYHLRFEDTWPYDRVNPAILLLMLVLSTYFLPLLYCKGKGGGIVSLGIWERDGWKKWEREGEEEKGKEFMYCRWNLKINSSCMRAVWSRAKPCFRRDRGRKWPEMLKSHDWLSERWLSSNLNFNELQSNTTLVKCPVLRSSKMAGVSVHIQQCCPGLEVMAKTQYYIWSDGGINGTWFIAFSRILTCTFSPAVTMIPRSSRRYYLKRSNIPTPLIKTLICWKMLLSRHIRVSPPILHPSLPPSFSLTE